MSAANPIAPGSDRPINSSAMPKATKLGAPLARATAHLARPALPWAQETRALGAGARPACCRNECAERVDSSARASLPP